MALLSAVARVERSASYFNFWHSSSPTLTSSPPSSASSVLRLLVDVAWVISSTMNSSNPLAFLGLRRVKSGDGAVVDEVEESSKSSVALNRRGVPARKRKKNSLIYAPDEFVSIPVRSPKKKRNNGEENDTSLETSPRRSRRQGGKVRGVESRSSKKHEEDVVNDDDEDDDDDDGGEAFREDEDKDDDDVFKADEDYEDDDEIDYKPVTRTSSAKSRRGKRLRQLPNRDAHENDDDDLPPRLRVGSPKRLPIALFSPKRGTNSPSKKGSRGIAVKKSSEQTKDAIEDDKLTKVSESLGLALRNLLKLPKAHKWVCFEFFYSNVDKSLFLGENDFVVCLRESFPTLRTRRLRRVEWSKIRQLMGRPRRCSPAFFAEEREELERKRQKIRLLQQRRQNEVENFKDLPEEIPLQLTIGTKVTARLRQPQDGLFTGTIEAYDTSNNTYRITFDRQSLGTRSISDVEVSSVEETVETLPLSTFTTFKLRPRPIFAHQHNESSPTSPFKMGVGVSPQQQRHQLANDPLLSGCTPRGKVMHVDGRIGGYPIKFLDQIVRLTKCLKSKKTLVQSLRQLNVEGERKKCFGDYISEDFQRRYAAIVIELSHVNKELNDYLKSIREFTTQFSSEAGPTISPPNIIKESCQEEAYNMVNRFNSEKSKKPVENPRMLNLVSSLSALMLHLKFLAEGERSAYELQALQESLGDLKSHLQPSNVARFENGVEVHMEHIQSGITNNNNESEESFNANSHGASSSL